MASSGEGVRTLSVGGLYLGAITPIRPLHSGGSQRTGCGPLFHGPVLPGAAVLLMTLRAGGVAAAALEPGWVARLNAWPLPANVANQPRADRFAILSAVSPLVGSRHLHWVYDPDTGQFGPGKFVGLADMTLANYDRAHRYANGAQKRRAIERALDDDLAERPNWRSRLRAWGTSSIVALL